MENAKQAYPIIDEIARLIGDSAALVVVGNFAGRTIVPSDRRREIEAMIGVELATTLARHFRRVPIYIPMCRRTISAARHKAIVERFDQLTRCQSARTVVAELAREYALSERHVWRILKRGAE